MRRQHARQALMMQLCEPVRTGVPQAASLHGADWRGCKVLVKRVTMSTLAQRTFPVPPYKFLSIFLEIPRQAF